MALLKLSALVSEMKGKLNGSVFQGSKYGQMLRNNKSRRFRSSLNWDIKKAQFAALSQQFRDLDATQLASFQNQAPNYPQTDRFGNLYEPSAFELFMLLNLPMVYTGQPVITTCNPPASTDPLVNAVFNWDMLGNFDLSFDTYAQTDVLLLVYMTSRLSANVGLSFQRYPLIGSLLIDGLDTYALSSDYIARYGSVPSNGRIGLRYKLLNLGTGQLSSPVTLEASL